MSISTEVVEKWTDEQLVKEFEQRVDLLKQLVGALYPSIVGDEMAVIEEVAIKRHSMHPNAWRAQNIVPSSWTDYHGVVHAWGTPCASKDGWRTNPTPDYPVQVVTCLLCIGG